MARKKKEVVEEVVVEKPKRTRATKKKVEEPKPIVIVNEPPKKRTRKKKEEEPKLASTPPKVEKVIEKPKEQPKPKKPKKPILKVKDFYEFEEGKYVLGDVEELFDEKLLKKMKTSIKKLSKKNHGKDDKLGTFEVGKQPGAVLIENLDWDNFKLTENSTTRRII